MIQYISIWLSFPSSSHNLTLVQIRKSIFEVHHYLLFLNRSIMKLSILFLFTVALCSSMLIGATTVEEDDLVRSQCKAIFEAGFPQGRFTTKHDLEAFASMASTKATDTSMACPVGIPDRAITNVTFESIMDWFNKHGFIPSEDFQYASSISSPIMVSGKVCAFEHSFFGMFEGSCHMRSKGHVVIEVDDEGNMVHWADHWDFNAFNAKVGECMAKLEATSKEES